MSISMMMNLNLLGDTTSEIVDATLYRQMIGSLMYLMNTRDICFVVNTFSQYMVEPRHVHVIVTNNVLRYLKGTINYGLQYDTNYEFILVGFTYLDWADSVTDRKSISRCCFSLGSTVIAWHERKQMSVGLDTIEAEYSAACSSCSEALWL